MHFLSLSHSVGKKKREKITRSQKTGGLKPQHHCGGGWKQQDMDTKSTQTQYGRKFDGRCHNKTQTGYANKTPMPGNAVAMIIFQIKRIT